MCLLSRRTNKSFFGNIFFKGNGRLNSEVENDDILQIWNNEGLKQKDRKLKRSRERKFLWNFFPFSKWAPARFVFSFECWRKQSRSLWYCPTHRSEYSIHRGWGDFHVTARYFSRSPVYSSILSKHLKGRLGPRVSDVTFLDQRRSVGVPC